METQETKTVKYILQNLSTLEREQLIDNSNLTDKEKQVLTLRFSKGKQVKECTELLNMEFEAFNKLQKKSVFKLYHWLERKALTSGIQLRNIK